MNNVTLIGRLTKDPETTQTQSGHTVVRFSLAVDRRGKDAGADFPTCVAFDKTAELIGKYCKKGDRLGVVGRIQTGSYEKDGRKVYTTDVVVREIELLGGRREESAAEPQESAPQFTEVEDDELPF